MIRAQGGDPDARCRWPRETHVVTAPASGVAHPARRAGRRPRRLAPRRRPGPQGGPGAGRRRRRAAREPGRRGHRGAAAVHAAHRRARSASTGRWPRSRAATRSATRRDSPAARSCSTGSPELPNSGGLSAPWRGAPPDRPSLRTSQGRLSGRRRPRATKAPTSQASLPVLMVLLLVTGLIVGGAGSYVLWARQGATGPARRLQPPPDRGRSPSRPRCSEVVLEALDDVAPECTHIEPQHAYAQVASRSVCSVGGDLPDVGSPSPPLVESRLSRRRGVRLRMLAPEPRADPRAAGRRSPGPTLPLRGETRRPPGSSPCRDPQVSTVGTLAVVAPQAEARRLGRNGPRRAPADGAVRPVLRGARARGARQERVADDVQAALAPSRRDHRAGPGHRRVDAPWLHDLTPGGGRPGPGLPARGPRRHPSPGRIAVARRLPTTCQGRRGVAALRRPASGPPGAATADVVSDVSTLPPPAARQGRRRRGDLVAVAQRSRRRSWPSWTRRAPWTSTPGPGSRMDPPGRRGRDRAVVPPGPRPGRAVGVLDRPGRPRTGLAGARADPAARRPALRSHPALRAAPAGG